MIRTISLRTSGVETPEFAALFGTAEAVPSREPYSDGFERFERRPWKPWLFHG
jgi:hypothetical protein